VGRAKARGLCLNSGIAARASPFQLPPAATGVIAFSSVLPALVWRVGLPLLGTASFIATRFRWTRFALVALNVVLPLVPVHLPLIPLLLRSIPFHTLRGGLLPRGIVFHAPLNRSGCLPPCF